MASSHAVKAARKRKQNLGSRELRSSREPAFAFCPFKELYQIQVEFFFYRIAGVEMLVFRDNYLYKDPFVTIFLCGSKYSPNSAYDKRIVLKNYIENRFPNSKAIILEEHFVFKNGNKRYLAYDDIYLKGLAQVEELASLFASRIVIIHETISTAAEIGMFASNTATSEKVCLLVPDVFSVEEDKTGNFIKLSFLGKDVPQTKVKLIRYYPDIEVHRFSENKSDYHTFFHNNQIGRVLGKQIDFFLFPPTEKEEKAIKFGKAKYGKPHKSPAIVDYHIIDETQTISVDVHVDTLKKQLLSMLFVEEFRKELWKEKRIREHVTYLLERYQALVKNTICDIEGKECNNYKVKLTLKDSMCEAKQAIGYFLYMLQAAGLIGLEQKDSGNPAIRKVRFSTALEQYSNQLANLIYDSRTTEFGRLAL